MRFKEKRKYKRVYDEVLVKIQGAMFYTENLSQRGAFIRCEKLPMLLPSDNVFELELLLPPRQDKIRIKSRLVYVLDKDLAKLHQRYPGIGVEFVEFDGDSEAKLRFYLERLEQMWDISDNNGHDT